MRQLFVLALLACCSTIYSQLNTTLRSSLDYTSPVNDIWGYVAPDGTEYAIVGLDDGVSFVSLADPDNATEVVRINGDRSIWRDMKTFGDYAYNVADQGQEGISAFDLRFLPDSVPFKKTVYPSIIGNGRTFIQAHNIYLDEEKGWLYTAGGDRQINDGGILIFDLNPDPMVPTYIGRAPATYSHDVYSKGDTLYCSEIYDGELAIYDISDLNDIKELGTEMTPFLFTHNAWTTDDAQTIFTTDERANAPVGAYDISNKDDIQKLFEFRPLASIGNGTIPHNVHVIDDYLSISYYTDGLVVADASKPDNIIEVANYDTWPGPDGDFNGAWGAYPFLPSGLTLVSDRATGLYVIEVDYKRAARLEGFITDADLGTPINNVAVSIAATQVNTAVTDALGNYKTGLANGGSYEVTFTADNYEPLTVTVEMANDLCLRLDTTLQSNVRRFNIKATVVDDETGAPISDAHFQFTGEGENYNLLTGVSGEVNIPAVFEGQYNLYVTEWGYLTAGFNDISPEDLQDVVIRLTPGYMDDFVTDEGWTAEATDDTRKGFWERGTPRATTYSGGPMAPGFDAANDFGRQAYVTGLPNASASSDDVDGGTVTLTSPKFGPLRNSDLMVSYEYWFANDGGNSAPNDLLSISITNGTDTKLVKEYSADGFPSWIADSFRVEDFVSVTDELQLIVVTSDFDDQGHLVEAGFDKFLVYGTAWAVNTENYEVDDLQVTVFPNPSAATFKLDFASGQLDDVQLRVSDVAGRVLSQRKINANSVVFGQQLPAGVYLAELLSAGKRVYVTKLIKE